MSLKTRIVGLVGTPTSTDAEITQYIQDGIVDVVNKSLAKSPEAAREFSKVHTVSDANGVPINGPEAITSVFLNNVEATEFRRNNKKSAVVASSIHYRTASNPGFFTENGSVYIVPYPSVNSSAAITSYATYSAGTRTKVTSTASHGLVTGSLITIAGCDISAYNGDWIVTETVDEDEFVINVAFVSVASTQGTFTGVSGEVNMIGYDTTAAQDSTSILNMPDYRENSVILYASTRCLLANMSLLTYDMLNGIDPASYTAPVVFPDFQKAIDYLNVDDIELVQSQLALINVQLGEYSGNLQNSLNKFNKESQEYQAEVQAKLAEFQHTSAKYQFLKQEYLESI